MADALPILARLRRLAADQARRALAAALAEERSAAALESAALAALRREAQFAPADATHPLAGCFSAWLPAGQSAVHGASAIKNAAVARVGDARGLLGQARAAERAVAHVREARAVQARANQVRAEQVRLDDLGRFEKAD
jgi:hypothetical protein